MALNINGTTGISGVDGSASAPAVQGTDGNTGLSFGSDVIDLNTGGSSRFKIGAAGPLGVAGANYGTAGQALLSQGASAAPQWGAVAGGKFLKVEQTIKLNAFSGGNGSFTDVTGLSVTITPSAAGSKILVNASFAMSTHDNKLAVYSLLRGSTAILFGDANSANIRGTGGIGNQNSNGVGNIYDMNRLFLDSPSYTLGNSLTYKIQVFGDGQDVMINRHFDPNTGPDYGRFASTMIAMEIGA